MLFLQYSTEQGIEHVFSGITQDLMLLFFCSILSKTVYAIKLPGSLINLHKMRANHIFSPQISPSYG